LPGDVTRSDRGEHGLGLSGGDVAFRLSWQEFCEQSLESVDGLDPPAGECFAAVGEHPQCLELAVEMQHPQVLGAHGNSGDRVGVVGVGLAVVAGVEEPDPGGELGRHVDHVFPVLKQSLGQGPSGAVAAIDRPNPLRPSLGVAAHRGVAGPVGGEPA
jgi:hypothetical protein